MKQTLLSIALFSIFSAGAQTPIFTPSMAVTPYGIADSPANEGYLNLIDGNIQTKFLDFSYEDGMGITVDTGVSASYPIATSIYVTTADDSPERDPINFDISASNDGATFTPITTGTMNCITARHFTKYLEFNNTTGYRYYRIVFYNQCNVIEAILQVAEVQLTAGALGVVPVTAANSTVTVYPNPVEGRFKVDSGSSAGIDAVTIADLAGKIVSANKYLSPISSTEVNVEGIAPGVYFAAIELDGMRVVKKLIIK